MILTLQKSKSNLREETINENQKRNKLNKLKMDFGKITIYPNADGITPRKKKKEEFKELGRFDPWQSEDKYDPIVEQIS